MIRRWDKKSSRHLIKKKVIYKYITGQEKVERRWATDRNRRDERDEEDGGGGKGGKYIN